MKPYLEAHDAFVRWLHGAAECEPTVAEVDRELRSLAVMAAGRGMSALHWVFVVDGLIAHTKRNCPHNEVLLDYVARGFDLVKLWPDIQAESKQSLQGQ